MIAYSTGGVEEQPTAIESPNGQSICPNFSTVRSLHPVRCNVNARTRVLLLIHPPWSSQQADDAYARYALLSHTVWYIRRHGAYLAC